MRLTLREFNNLPLVGEGTEGVVRALNSKVVAKFILNFPKEKKDNIAIQYRKSNDTFAFPIEELYIGREYSGYLMEYVKGILIDELLPIVDYDIVSIIKLFDKVKEDLMVLVDNNLIAQDLKHHNCIFDEHLRFIDTSRYQRDMTASKEQLLATNYTEFNRVLFRLIFMFESEMRVIKNIIPSDPYMKSLYISLLSKGNNNFITVFLIELMERKNITNFKELDPEAFQYVNKDIYYN